MNNNESNVIGKSDADRDYDISDLDEVCSELTRLVVSLFNIEKKEFVYCSRSARQVLGYRPETVIESGLDFWYSLLKPKQRPVVRQKLTSAIFDDSARPGTYSLAYHIKKPGGEWISVKHEIYHKRYAEKLIALNMLYDNSERELINRYLGIPRPGDFAAGANGIAKDITEREKQVLKLIACGLSSRQIAEKLYISRHTAVSHRKNLIKKFRVKNTAELIKKASKIIPL